MENEGQDKRRLEGLICGKSEGLAGASDFFVEVEGRIYFTMNL